MGLWCVWADVRVRGRSAVRGRRWVDDRVVFPEDEREADEDELDPEEVHDVLHGDGAVCGLGGEARRAVPAVVGVRIVCVCVCLLSHLLEVLTLLSIVYMSLASEYLVFRVLLFRCRPFWIALFVPV